MSYTTSIAHAVYRLGLTSDLLDTSHVYTKHQVRIRLHKALESARTAEVEVRALVVSLQEELEG